MITILNQIFKYRFILIKFHPKKMLERKNIVETTKTKHAITKFFKIFEWGKNI